jgi:DNA-binding PadR family transcriptional regulator
MKYISRSEELVLLSVWKLKEDSYGVAIRNYMSELTGHYWSIGSIYVPLDRLEGKGYISSYLADSTPERGGKSKRFYQLTDDGLKKLKEIKKINELFWNDLPDLST